MPCGTEPSGSRRRSSATSACRCSSVWRPWAGLPGQRGEWPVRPGLAVGLRKYPDPALPHPVCSQRRGARTPATHPTNERSRTYFSSYGLEWVRQKLAHPEAAREYADDSTFQLQARLRGLFKLINGHPELPADGIKTRNWTSPATTAAVRPGTVSLPGRKEGRRPLPVGRAEAAVLPGKWPR